VPEPTTKPAAATMPAHRPLPHAASGCQLRHVLFAVTPGVDVVALRQRAELPARAALRRQRCAVRRARCGELSNCPSGADGGALGWLTPGDCAPEFAREVFGQPEVGVLPRLVHSRFGLHVVEVLERDPGRPALRIGARCACACRCASSSWAVALRQYLLLLAGAATIEGIDLDRSDSPLVQ
jgi:peptidyl-prolyl cis-trans isomerase C